MKTKSSKSTGKTMAFYIKNKEFTTSLYIFSHAPIDAPIDLKNALIYIYIYIYIHVTDCLL